MKKKIKIILIIIIMLVAVVILGRIGYYLKNLAKEKEYFEPEYNSEYITNINTIEINNDEIGSRYQFVFITDLHASIEDENEQDEQIKESLVERRLSFVSLNQNQATPENIFNEIINYTNNKNADALLLGGDIIDSPSDSNINFLRDNLANLNTEYLYTFGNHDWAFGWEPRTEEIEDTYYPKFSEFMDDTEVSYLEYEDLIILSINDGRNQISSTALEKIKTVLEKGKPTIVMMHVPIATEYIASETIEKRDRNSSIGGEYGIKVNEDTQEALDLLVSGEYNVFYIISGHTHIELEDTVNGIPEYVTAPAYEGHINVIKINN